LGRHTTDQGIVYFGVGDPRRGIVHVIGPEQGLTVPGITLVCGDSHTATHGAFGALAFGIGSSEVEHVLATQTLWQKKPLTMRISVEGRLGPGVNAKDVILASIAKIGAAAGGTRRQAALPITGRGPDPSGSADAGRRESMTRALAYMGLSAGTPLSDITVDRVFIGSCTNSRLDDLRAAARIAKGRRAVVPAWIVPGSGLIKRAAEAEGLDRVFVDAGFEWREAGCSMCVGMKGETAAA